MDKITDKSHNWPFLVTLLSGYRFSWQMILKYRTLRLENRPYCVKSDPIMWNHRDFWVKHPFFGFIGPWRPMKCLKKKRFPWISGRWYIPHLSNYDTTGTLLPIVMCDRIIDKLYRSNDKQLITFFHLYRFTHINQAWTLTGKYGTLHLKLFIKFSVFYRRLIYA